MSIPEHTCYTFLVSWFTSTDSQSLPRILKFTILSLLSQSLSFLKFETIACLYSYLLGKCFHPSSHTQVSCTVIQSCLIFKKCELLYFLACFCLLTSHAGKFSWYSIGFPCIQSLSCDSYTFWITLHMDNQSIFPKE